MKEIFFNVINFVEKEKLGPIIPLFNVNERLSSMLNISMRSVERMKNEMREIEHEMMARKRKMDEEKQQVEDQKLQVIRRLRNLRSRSSLPSSSTSTTNTDTKTTGFPVPNPPRKLSNSGRPSIILTEQQQENIR
jgi:Sec-independent protein translocase protein TatA